MHRPKRREARKLSIAIMRVKVAPMVSRPRSEKKPGITGVAPHTVSSSKTTPTKNPRNISKTLHVECFVITEVHLLS